MKLSIFSVYDVKADCYLPPFFMASVGQAKRVFGDCANDKSHQFGKHPEDYTLFKVGEIDDVDCSFDIFSVKQSLGLALEYVEV